MEFTNEFTIPLNVDDAFAALTDLERVAPCMPGATLDEVAGDGCRGHMKVKIGPVSMTYQGTARLLDVDRENYVVRIEASGRETRGSGTASATVTSTLADKGGETQVTVVSDINVTGRPAQFGRGTMADIGARIIDRFAACLAELEVSAEVDASAPAAGAGSAVENSPDRDGPTEVPTSDSRGLQPPAREDTLNLMEVAGWPAAKRLLPLVAAGVLIVVVWRWPGLWPAVAVGVLVAGVLAGVLRGRRRR